MSLNTRSRSLASLPVVTAGAALVLLVTLTIVVASRGPMGRAAREAGAEADAVKRGEYLVTVLGCHDCHTPWVEGPDGPAPDMTRALSGHPQDVVMPAPGALEMPWGWAGAATNTAYAGPWGVSYAINLTPEPNTGIGIWTEDIFVNTIRSGRHWGVSRPILPPMPWQNFRELTDEDLHAVWSYLRSIPPVVNRIQDAVLAPDPTH